MGYQCINGDGNAASILLTVLDTGDVSGLCGECVPTAARGLLEATTGVQWEPVEGRATDPETDEPTDEPDGTAAPVVDPSPAPEEPPSEGAGEADDDKGDDPTDPDPTGAAMFAHSHDRADAEAAATG